MAPKPQAPFRLFLAARAEEDIAAIRAYSIEHFGTAAAKAYLDLIRQALKDIRADPLHALSRERAEIGPGVRSYHISLSRERAGSPVRSPRHFVLYYRRAETEIAVSRILHEARDIGRHVPEGDIGEAGAFGAEKHGETDEGGGGAQSTLRGRVPDAN